MSFRQAFGARTIHLAAGYGRNGLSDACAVSFKVIRHVRPKFACSGCERVVEAPAPSRPIERGLAGPGLLAHVLVSKFADHLPLYRQSEIYARQGVEIERSTLAGWVGGASELLTPLVDAIRKHVITASKIHADDTPIPVLAPGSGKTKTGRLWTYVRDDRPAGEDTAPAVWFAYSEDRKGEHPRQHLKAFRGGLQADAYAGFHHLYGDGAIYEVACWAHARRKFHEIHVRHTHQVPTKKVVDTSRITPHPDQEGDQDAYAKHMGPPFAPEQRMQ
jgi:hypothetical protein